MRYLTDQDARPPGSSSSQAHLWDSGANAVDELNRIMQVRAAALKRFGENNIREGAPLATLEDVLVPIYLLHRYQVEAASKVVGGMDYTFALRGDGETPTQIVAPAEQRRALAAILATVKPEVLALPEPLLKIIPPAPARLRTRTREISKFTPVRRSTHSLPRKPARNNRCNSCSIRNAPRDWSNSTRAIQKIPH